VLAKGIPRLREDGYEATQDSCRRQRGEQIAATHDLSMQGAAAAGATRCAFFTSIQVFSTSSCGDRSG